MKRLDIVLELLNLKWNIKKDENGYTVGLDKVELRIGNVFYSKNITAKTEKAAKKLYMDEVKGKSLIYDSQGKEKRELKIPNSFYIKNKKYKLKRILNCAKEDLGVWLELAGCKTLEEFYKREKELSETISYKSYKDVLDHIQYIKKLKKLIKEIKSGRK